MKDKLDILPGTLDLMVLRTLSTLGPLHGYGIARRIEQVSGDQVILNQGTIYTSLVRLQQRAGFARDGGPPTTTVAPGTTRSPGRVRSS